MEKRRLSARSERRAIIALMALFALLIQALAPMVASAAPNGQYLGVLCGAHGVERAPSGGESPRNQAPGGACDHCVCPVGAATPPSAAGLAPETVSYVAQVERHASPDDAVAPGRGLAAPPPPSRGPPSLTI